MVTDHLGDDKGEEFFSELGIQLSFGSQRPQALHLARFAFRVCWRQVRFSFELTYSFCELEPFGQRVNENCVQVVDAIAQALELRVCCHCFSVKHCGARRAQSIDALSPSRTTVFYTETMTTHPELERLRNSIDNLDAVLIHALAERFKLTERVGELKAETNLPPADPEREARQVKRLRALASEAQLDPEFAEKFLAFIVAEVIRHHERIAEEKATQSNPDEA